MCWVLSFKNMNVLFTFSLAQREDRNEGLLLQIQVFLYSHYCLFQEKANPYKFGCNRTPSLGKQGA